MENPSPKPLLDQILPESYLNEKVDDVIRKSEALTEYWKRPITTYQLSEEMTRMARNTKQPELLKEIWNALGNDPYMIAECMARPILADRLIRNWYAFDERIHGELRTKARDALKTCSSLRVLKSPGSNYIEIEYIKAANDPRTSDWIDMKKPDKASLNEAEWQQLISVLAREFNGTLPGVDDIWRDSASFDLSPNPFSNENELPEGTVSQLLEDEDSYYAKTIIRKNANSILVGTIMWHKVPFEEWWRKNKLNFTNQIVSSEYE